ncbi:MAG: methyltransferase domain-containing protein [Gammaproteobacteria bacterium]|nr:methyltransferase domain-containing protein [Gammaproteobacteria bacterium]
MSATYIMEDDREAMRLSQKVDPSDWVKRFFAPFLTHSQHVLDVGAGSGILAAEIARQYPEKTVVGIDISETRLKHAREHYPLPSLSFNYADSTALPFPDGNFDLVYSRLMLEYLKHPEVSVCEMARVCKPGGKVILQDLDGQLIWHYPVPDFQEEMDRVLVEMAKTGHDVLVGRKLFSFAKAAGLTNITVSVDPYHLYAGRVNEKELMEWELKLDIALPLIEQVYNKEKALELKQKFLSYLLDQNTLTYSVLFTVVGEAV